MKSKRKQPSGCAYRARQTRDFSHVYFPQFATFNSVLRIYFLSDLKHPFPSKLRAPDTKFPNSVRCPFSATSPIAFFFSPSIFSDTSEIVTPTQLFIAVKKNNMLLNIQESVVKKKKKSSFQPTEIAFPY